MLCVFSKPERERLGFMMRFHAVCVFLLIGVLFIFLSYIIPNLSFLVVFIIGSRDIRCSKGCNHHHHHHHQQQRLRTAAQNLNIFFYPRLIILYQIIRNTEIRHFSSTTGQQQPHLSLDDVDQTSSSIIRFSASFNRDTMQHRSCFYWPWMFTVCRRRQDRPRFIFWK